MKERVKHLLAVIVVLAFTLGISVCGYAAEDIVLDGDLTGGSSFIGEYSPSGGEYQYLGYATTKEATSEYKFLKLTYKGDLSTFRIEFNRLDNSVDGPYWFNKEWQTKYFQAVNGKEFPLKTKKEKTVVFDLEAMGVNIGEFVGIHLHALSPEVQEASISIIDARLMTDEKGNPAESQVESTETTVAETESAEEVTSVVDSTGTDGTAGGSTEAPSSVPPILPIVIVLVVGAGVAVAAFVFSKGLKK